MRRHRHSYPLSPRYAFVALAALVLTLLHTPQTPATPDWDLLTRLQHETLQIPHTTPPQPNPPSPSQWVWDALAQADLSAVAPLQPPPHTIMGKGNHSVEASQPLQLVVLLEATDGTTHVLDWVQLQRGERHALPNTTTPLTLVSDRLDALTLHTPNAREPLPHDPNTPSGAVRYPWRTNP